MVGEWSGPGGGGDGCWGWFASLWVGVLRRCVERLGIYREMAALLMLMQAI